MGLLIVIEGKASPINNTVIVRVFHAQHYRELFDKTFDCQGEQKKQGGTRPEGCDTFPLDRRGSSHAPLFEREVRRADKYRRITGLRSIIHP